MKKKSVLTKISLSKVIEWGVYLLAFLLPLQTRFFLDKNYLYGEYWELGTVSVYLIDFLIISLLFLSFYNFLTKNKKLESFNIDKIWFILGFFELVVFVSIFFSDHILLSFYGYLKILLGFSVFYLLLSTPYDKRKLYWSFLSAVFLQSILAIWQVLNNYSFSSKFLGMAEHSPSQLGASVVELEGGTRLLRAYGSLDHPNMLGVLVFFGLVFLTNYFLKNYRPKSIFSFHFIPYFFSFFILSLALFFSFSKTGFILLLFLVFYLIFLTFKKRDFVKKIISLLLVLALFSAGFSYLASPYILQRLDNNSRLERISNNERISQIDQAGEIISEHPITGVGINSYTAHLASQDAELSKPWDYQPVHNVFLLVVSEIGVFGLLSFLTFLFYVMYSGFSRQNYFQVFLMISLLVSFLFDHWFWSLHFGIIFMFFIIALAHRRAIDFY